MSRMYLASVRVDGVKRVHRAVKRVVSDMMGEDVDLCVRGFRRTGSLTATGVVTLYGGESETEYSRRLTHALWVVHGCCDVEVLLTYLDAAPSEVYRFGRREYARFKRERRKR